MCISDGSHPQSVTSQVLQRAQRRSFKRCQLLRSQQSELSARIPYLESEIQVMAFAFTCNWLCKLSLSKALLLNLCLCSWFGLLSRIKKLSEEEMAAGWGEVMDAEWETNVERLAMSDDEVSLLLVSVHPNKFPSPADCGACCECSYTRSSSR